jgi:hypothetical protein
MNWTPETVLRAILDDPYVEKLGSWRLRGERALAQGIEARQRQDRNGPDPKGESPVATPCAQNQSAHKRLGDG